MPANVAFPTSSTPGYRPGEGAGRLVNCYADKEGQAVAIFRSAGLDPWVDTGFSGPRGMLPTESALYVALSEKLVSITSGGVVTSLTNGLAGSLPVTMARNNAATPDIAINTENGAFGISAGAVISWADSDVGSPNSVASLDGYFIWTKGNGEIMASDLNSVAVNSLSVAKAESNPDGLLRGVVRGGVFYAMGTSTIEPWYNAGTSPFPLARATSIIPVGLFGTWAVAGYEDGWDGPLFITASDGTVRQINGFDTQRVSTRDVERAIQGVAVTSTLKMFVYTSGGNAWLVVTSPTWTWELNIRTGEWNERESFGLTRWRGETSAHAFGRWIVGDTGSTFLQHITDAALDEAGQPLVAQCEGVLKEFPARMRIPGMYFDFTVGQGDVQGDTVNETDPRVAIEWSHDGGATWSNPAWRALGAQGQTKTQVRVNNMGRTTPQGMRVRCKVSDPVWMQFRGAGVINPIARRP